MAPKLFVLNQMAPASLGADAIAALFSRGLVLGSDTQPDLLSCLADVQSFLEVEDSSNNRVDAADVDENIKHACYVFTARTLRGCRRHHDVDRGHLRNQGLQLSKIAKAANTSLFDLFRELPVTLEKTAPLLLKALDGNQSKIQELRVDLRNWQKVVVATALLSRKFKELLNTLLDLEGAQSEVMQVAWNLFLVLKLKLLPKFPDLVSSVEVMVCTLHLLLTIEPDLRNSSVLKLAPASGPCVKEIADLVRADAARIEQLYPEATRVAKTNIQSLSVQQPPNDSHQKQDQNIKPQASLQGILRDGSRRKLLLKELDAVYEAFYESEGEVDEREFLSQVLPREANVDPSRQTGGLQTPWQEKSPGVSPCNGNSPVQPAIVPGLMLKGQHVVSMNQLYASPVFANTPVAAGVPTEVVSSQGVRLPHLLSIHSPLPSSNLGLLTTTPISEAMNMSSWFKQVTSKTVNEPLATTKKLLELSKGGESAAIALKQYLVDLTMKVLPDPPTLVTFSGGTFSARREEVLKMYWRALESILVEEERSGTPTTLLVTKVSSTKFNRSLLSCCFELLVASYRMVTLSFPTVLERICVPVFEFANMIHLFVRHEPTLPKELKRHMFLIEERILESMAWEPGSVLYQVIASQVAGSESQIKDRQDNPNIPPKSPKRSLGEGEGKTAFASPLKRQRPVADAVQHAISPLMKPLKPNGLEQQLRPLSSGATDNKVVPALQEFYRRVLKLAYHRLVALCEKFNFAPLDRAAVVMGVYSVFKSALQEHTHLFYNRHMDQVLLCALYGFCKAQKLNSISFREIIQRYRAQPHGLQQVFRSVVLEQDHTLQVHKRGDIIAFYNSVFVPSMKPFLVEQPQCNVPSTNQPVAHAEAGTLVLAKVGVSKEHDCLAPRELQHNTASITVTVPTLSSRLVRVDEVCKDKECNAINTEPATRQYAPGKNGFSSDGVWGSDASNGSASHDTDDVPEVSSK